MDYINNIWASIKDKLQNNQLTLSSEKTLVFHFAWQIGTMFPQITNSIDFEKKLFDNFSDGTFLDLYYNDSSNHNIGIEFKYPKKSDTGNSNQTQTRVKIINDIKRLSYLINNKKIDFGYFLMITDEKPYTENGKKEKEKEFETYHKKSYKKDCPLPKNGFSRDEVKLPNDITFEWEKVLINNKDTWFLKPIEIRLTSRPS